MQTQSQSTMRYHGKNSWQTCALMCVEPPLQPIYVERLPHAKQTSQCQGIQNPNICIYALNNISAPPPHHSYKLVYAPVTPLVFSTSWGISYTCVVCSDFSSHTDWGWYSCEMSPHNELIHAHNSIVLEPQRGWPRLQAVTRPSTGLSVSCF